MTGFLTIISKNYLPYARVLMRSVAQRHPDAIRIVVLTDAIDNYFDPAAEPFHVIHTSEAGLPRQPWFEFRYTVLELNTAVKPYVLEYAFRHFALDKLFYLDPDVKLYRALTPLEDALDQCAVVLTPHLTAPLPNDGKEPSELDILRSGTYNLGFLALRGSHPTTTALLHWWQAKLEYGCKLDFARGLFVDQRWMDLVPGLFPDVLIWRDPEYNIAYWNLPTRSAGADEPPAFFHFSGFDAADPERFSKYQNRLTLSDTGPAVQALALAYAAELQAAGLPEARYWPYTHRYLADCTPIPDLCRAWENASLTSPYTPEGTAALLAWWNALQPPSTLLTRFAFALYRARPDLYPLFPDPLGHDQESLLTWLLHHGKHEQAIPEAFLQPLRDHWHELHPRHPDGSKIAPAPPPPPRLWPDLPEVAELIYATRPDLQALFPPSDRAGFTRWLLTAALSEYLIDKTEIHTIAEAHRLALASLPSPLPRWRHKILLRTARSRPDPDPTAPARRRSHLFHPPPPPMPRLLVDANDPLLAGLRAAAPSGDAGARTFHLTRQVEDQGHPGSTIAYLYRHFASTAGESLAANLAHCREVWTPSSFLQDAWGPRLQVPVLKMPLPLRGVARRSHPEFTYLAVLDASDDPERQNLAAVLEAFRIALPAGARLRIYLTPATAAIPLDDTGEVISGNGLEAEFDETLATADCLLAPTHSDAYGYALGRALATGLPVICTAYAGHLELVGPGRAYLLDYRLRERPGTIGVWAEPSLPDIVEAIRAVHRDSLRREAVAAAGQEYVQAHFSPLAIAERLQQRLRFVKGT